MSASPSEKPLIFRHEAMSTWFEIRIAGEEPHYARRAAEEVWRLVDQLENRLSRYRDDSEIAFLRGLSAGESLRLHPDTVACLQLASEVQQITGGAFDPTLGAAIDRQRESVGRPVAKACSCEDNLGPGRLVLDETSMMAFCEKAPLDFDLGAIGKGFALDRAGELLGEWEIGAALLIAGGSSFLALDGPVAGRGWEIGVTSCWKIELRNGGLGASGTSVRGEHILDPRTGCPAAGPFRTWAVSPSAALADAFSTAWMLLSALEIEQICQAQPTVAAMIQHHETDGAQLWHRGPVCLKTV